ncbi:MAG: hypothetical protein L6R40_000580 [Gallowayella cf. fulva]|nr:MAG: hypothetical protein L6R40_000580 [Xanthomendoza cf. fulva]
MSELQAIHTKEACPVAGPYSQALLTPHALYISGQLPALPSGDLPSGTLAYKTSLCIANIRAILSAAGSDITRVVKTTVFLTDMKNFAEVNAEYEKHFGVNGAPKPARSCVAVHQLPKGVEVEIECVALPGGAGSAAAAGSAEESERRVLDH